MSGGEEGGGHGGTLGGTEGCTGVHWGVHWGVLGGTGGYAVGRKESRMTVVGGRVVVVFTLHQYRVDSIAFVAFNDLSQYNFVQLTGVESTLVLWRSWHSGPGAREKRDQSVKSVHSYIPMQLRSQF